MVWPWDWNGCPIYNSRPYGYGSFSNNDIEKIRKRYRKRIRTLTNKIEQLKEEIKNLKKNKR